MVLTSRTRFAFALTFVLLLLCTIKTTTMTPQVSVNLVTVLVVVGILLRYVLCLAVIKLSFKFTPIRLLLPVNDLANYQYGGCWNVKSVNWLIDIAY